VVSRAFQVLSDPDKKQKFDKFGQDPDSRFQSSSAAAGASPFSGGGGFRSPGARGPMFEEEISPEELFRQFFGGGFGGGGFGGTSFYIYKLLINETNTYNRFRHRTRLCLQPRRRPWSTRPPIRRRQTKKKAGRRSRSTSIRLLNPHIPPPSNPPLHLPPPLLSLLQLRTFRTKYALRIPRTTTHTKTRLGKPKSTLLRQPHRSNRLHEKAMGSTRSNGGE
jgi:curved DNA-binding protein CbpA